MNNLQPHLKIKQGDISPYVLLPGDPDRVDIIGKKLKNFIIPKQNREFRIGIGNYNGLPITVCSTGIGCPSTAIAVEEFINAGAKYLIRVGTCGGAWRADIPVGSIIIPTASIRDEGTTKEYIPKSFPAVADYGLVKALDESANKLKAKYFIGIARTHDAFYGNQQSIKKWGAYLSDKRWQAEDTPILCSDMESSALFIISSLRNVKAAAILAVNARPEALKDRIIGQKQAVITEDNKEISWKMVDRMIDIALKALYSITKS